MHVRGRTDHLFVNTTSDRRDALACLDCWAFCSRSSAATIAAAAQPQSTQLPARFSRTSSAQSPDAGLPLNFERHTGDLDAMVKRGSIRALVLYSRSGFFYVNGQPEGIYYEALQYFEQFVNQKLHTRQHVQVTFIPVRPDQLEACSERGRGRPDRIRIGGDSRTRAAGCFLDPDTDRRETDRCHAERTSARFRRWRTWAGRKSSSIPLTTYYDNLEKVNESLRKQGKPPILIENADKSLMDEDLLEMVNAGIFPQPLRSPSAPSSGPAYFPELLLSQISSSAPKENLALAMRKNNPQLKQLVDEFVKTHAMGTSFGNTLWRRYLQSDQWVKNPTTAAELKKFEETVDFFKKYASQYGFDYLMVVAQGYQESMLNQSARSPGGAVGIMQVKPSTAAAPPISIPDIVHGREQHSRRSEAAEFDRDRLFQRPED